MKPAVEPAANRPVPAWAQVSSASAPVLLIGGWTLAAAVQPTGYDSIRDTISALAAYGARDRWLMTAALLGVGLCHTATAVGLRPARRAGRVVLGLGGIATIGVAIFPQSVTGQSRPHAVSASIAFVALAVWPLFASRRQAGGPLLTPVVSAAAGAALLALVVWFAAEDGSELRGLAERAAAGAQALWPLAVVVSTRRRQRRDLSLARRGTESV